MNPRVKDIFKNAQRGGGYILDRIFPFLGFSKKHHAVRAIKKLNEDDWKQVGGGSGRNGVNHEYIISKRGVFTILSKMRGKSADEFRAYLFQTREAYINNKQNILPEDVKSVENAYEKFLNTSWDIKKTLPERHVGNKLAEVLGEHKREHRLGLCGVVDFITPSEVIEVKHVRNWKSALGQVIIYSQHDDSKNRTCRIHLFGDVSARRMQFIVESCSKLNVRCTFG